jgi:hypothetical protein
MSALSAATADPGFRLDGGLLVEVDPSLAGYDEAQGRQSHLALVDRLRTVPGVEAVTIGSRLPFTSIGDSRMVAPAGTADARSRSVGAVFSVVFDCRLPGNGGAGPSQQFRPVVQSLKSLETLKT